MTIRKIEVQRFKKISALLNDVLKKYEKVVVAFSGGVDSTLLAAAALKSLGPNNVIAATAVSPSLGASDLQKCKEIAEELGLTWRQVKTNEFSNQDYLSNDKDRCYWCKYSLMQELMPISDEFNSKVILGVNLDDLTDYRPGQNAALKFGAEFPLVEAGLTKEDVRQLAKYWNLSNWDRPAQPCLASRIPYGTSITVGIMSTVDRAEMLLRDLGFENVRVRHYGDTARVEVPEEDLVYICENSEIIVTKLEELGYQYVTLDLKGLRSGNLNRALKND